LHQHGKDLIADVICVSFINIRVISLVLVVYVIQVINLIKGIDRYCRTMNLIQKHQTKTSAIQLVCRTSNRNNYLAND